MTINVTTLPYDKKVYYKNPSFCMDCKLLLRYAIRSNKRCVKCYKIKKIEDLKVK